MADKRENEENEKNDDDYNINRKRIRGFDPDYLSTLSKEDLARYLNKRKFKFGEKIEILPDPYKLPSKCWRNDPASWPSISYGDVYFYLIETPGPFDKSSMKSHRSLQAYDYFSSRKVGEVLVSIPRKDLDVVLLKASVRPGQAESSQSHNPWIIQKRMEQFIVLIVIVWLGE